MNVIYEIFFKSIHVSLLKYLAKLIQKKKKLLFLFSYLLFSYTYIGLNILSILKFNVAKIDAHYIVCKWLLVRVHCISEGS